MLTSSEFLECTDNNTDMLKKDAKMNDNQMKRNKRKKKKMMKMKKKN